MADNTEYFHCYHCGFKVHNNQLADYGVCQECADKHYNDETVEGEETDGEA